MRRSLSGSFLWTLFGNFTYGGCQWLMTIVVARWGTPEMVGQLALGFAITAPVFALSGLSLRTVQATDARLEFGFGHYLALRLLLSGCAAVGLVVLALCGPYPATVAWIMVAVAVAKSFEAVSDVFYGFFQAGDRFDIVSRSMAVKGLGSVAAVAGGLALFRSLHASVALLALTWGFSLVLVDVRAARRLASQRAQPLAPQLHWRDLARLTVVALPLGIASLLGSLQANVPRYFTEHHLGTRDLGFFAAAGYMTLVGARAVTALAESASPRLARLATAGDHAGFRALLLRLMAFGAAVAAVSVAGAWLLGGRVMGAVYGPDYAAHGRTLALLFLAAGIAYVFTFLQYALTAARHLRSQALIFGVALAVLAAACHALIPSHGTDGAAAAIVIANAVQLGANAWAMRRALAALHAGSSTVPLSCPASAQA